MKSILILLTLTLASGVADSVREAFCETPNPPSAQTNATPRPSYAPKFVDLDALFEDVNRAAKENDVDALREIVEKNLKEPTITLEIKIELAETLCVAQINALGRQGDREGLKAFSDELVDKASSIPAYAGCAKSCAELVSIYDRNLGADLQARLLNATRDAQDDQVQIAARYIEPIFQVPTSASYETLFDVEPGHDRAYYRQRLAELDKALRNVPQPQGGASRSQRDSGAPDFRFRALGARLRLLREIVLSDGDEKEGSRLREFRDYLDLLTLGLPKRETLTQNSTQTIEGLDSEFVAKAIAELKEKFFQNQIYANSIAELERRYHVGEMEKRFSDAINRSNVERQDFINFYRNELRAYPNAYSNAYLQVCGALDHSLRQFAANIVRALEEFQQEKPDDVALMKVIADSKRALNKPNLDALVGKPLRLDGIDADFNEFSLESLRGKYVVVYFVPSDHILTAIGEQDHLQSLVDFVKKSDPKKFAVLEYVRAPGDYALENAQDLHSEKIEKELDVLRAREWPVVVQGLSIRANVVYEKDYPAIFDNYRATTPLFALVDPKGVVLAVEPALWNVQRRLELIENSETKR